MSPEAESEKPDSLQGRREERIKVRRAKLFMAVVNNVETTDAALLPDLYLKPKESLFARIMKVLIALPVKDLVELIQKMCSAFGSGHPSSPLAKTLMQALNAHHRKAPDK